MRGVRQNDAVAIADLDMELFPDNCFNETTIRREIAAGGGLVIYDGDTLAAYTLVRWDWEVMDIIRLGVRPSYQGQGFGRKMLSSILNSTQLDAILCVSKTNRRALRLYDGHGFRIIGQLAQNWVMRRAT
jgi:ribosomal protein S18 acetylase RimI-like enzyme